MKHLHDGDGRISSPIARRAIRWATEIGLIASLVLMAFSGCRSAGEPSEPGESGAPRESATAAAQQAAGAPSPICITIQRSGASGTVFDAGIANKLPPKNYGASGTMNTGPVSGAERQSLIQFDLSAIPSGPGTTIQSATVKLSLGVLAPSGPGSIEAHNVLAPWSEATVTWQSFNGAYDPTVLATFSNTMAVPSFSIAQLVQDWVQGNVPNNGILLRSADGATTNFWTSEYATTAARPSLDVCYVVDPDCGFCVGDSWCTCGPNGVCYVPEHPLSVEHCTDPNCGFCVGDSWCTCGPNGVCYVPEHPLSIQNCNPDCGFCDHGSWCTCGPNGVCYTPDDPISIQHCDPDCGFCDHGSWCTCGPNGVCYTPDDPISIQHCDPDCGFCVGDSWCTCGPNGVCYVSTHPLSIQHCAPTPSCVTPPTGMVAWWPLDEISGSTAYDIIGANNGTHLNGPAPQPGMVAGSLSFDGVNDLVNAPRVIASHDYRALTVDAWIYPQAPLPSVMKQILDYGNGKYALYLEGSELVFEHQAIPLSFGQPSVGANIAANTWTHVAVVADPVAKQFRFYVNGVFVSAFATGFYMPTGFHANGNWTIGAGGLGMAGRIDEVEIFERVLSAAEINALFAAGPDGKCKSPSLSK